MKFRRICALFLVLSLIISIPALAESRASKVVRVAQAQMGKKYRLDADAPNSFNCASLIVYCVNSVKKGTVSMNGVKDHYTKVKSMSSLKPGDIVCYRNSHKKGLKVMGYHFGIYCGKGYMIHASRSAGKVICSKVRKYHARFIGGLRIF